MTINSGIQTTTATHPDLPIIIIMSNRLNQRVLCAPPLPHRIRLAETLFWDDSQPDRFIIMVRKHRKRPNRGGRVADFDFGSRDRARNIYMDRIRTHTLGRI
jgi:hypothetical protein